MTTITADDIRVLARSAATDAALARIGDEIRVVPDGDGPVPEVPADRIVYTKAQLIEDYGAELSDVEAEVLAAGLTAELADQPGPDVTQADVTQADAGARRVPEGTDVTRAPGAAEPPD